MKRQLDMDRIAEGLGRRAEGVSAKGGYFGAMQLLADADATFRVPMGSGDGSEVEGAATRPLAPQTLERLEMITRRVREHGGVNVEPMQSAALLLENATTELSEAEAEKLVRPRRRSASAQRG